jgi:hypothetical protein
MSTFVGSQRMAVNVCQILDLRRGGWRFLSPVISQSIYQADEVTADNIAICLGV